MGPREIEQDKQKQRSSDQVEPAHAAVDDEA
jgi:hypothetical protein